MTQSNILKCISVGHEIVIPELFNFRKIAQATDVFSSIGYGFEKISDQHSILPRLIGSTNVDVFEITQDAEPYQIFNSIYGNKSIDRLCMSQHQVISFVERHNNWLAKNYLTNFFLIKNRELDPAYTSNFSVVAITATERLKIVMFELDYKSLCSGMFPHRFFVPKI